VVRTLEAVQSAFNDGDVRLLCRAGDLVRRGSAWLLSFSDGDDPMPALA
jgi:hypothetical protein